MFIPQLQSTRDIPGWLPAILSWLKQHPIQNKECQNLACLWGYSLIVLLVSYPLEVIQLQISKAHWNNRLPYLRFYDIKIHTDFIQNAKWKRNKCVILYCNKSPTLDQQLNLSRILLLIRSKDQTQIASSQFSISTLYFNNLLRADEFIITKYAFGRGRVEQIMAATYFS